MPTKIRQLKDKIKALESAKATAETELEALNEQAKPGAKPTDLSLLTAHYLDEESRLNQIRPKLTALRQTIAALDAGIPPLQTELAELERVEAADTATKNALTALQNLGDLQNELNEAVESVKAVLLKIKNVAAGAQQDYGIHALATLENPHGKAPGRLVEVGDIALPRLEFNQPQYVQYSPARLTVEPFDLFTAEKAELARAAFAHDEARRAAREVSRAQIAAERAKLAAEAEAVKAKQVAYRAEQNTQVREAVADLNAKTPANYRFSTTHPV